MRFQKMARHAYVPAARKSAAILRRQRKEREALPLFADLVAAEQRSVEEEHAARSSAWVRGELEDRARRAADWRRARAGLRAIEPAPLVSRDPDLPADDAAHVAHRPARPGQYGDAAPAPRRIGGCAAGRMSRGRVFGSVYSEYPFLYTPNATR